MTITDDLIGQMKELAASGKPLGRCEHVKAHDEFTVFIQIPQMLCLVCAEQYSRACTCDKCGVTASTPLFCVFTIVHSGSSKEKDQFVAILCEDCGRTVPEGEWGRRGELFTAHDGRSMFFAGHLSTTRRLREVQL